MQHHESLCERLLPSALLVSLYSFYEHVDIGEALLQRGLVGIVTSFPRHPLPVASRNYSTRQRWIPDESEQCAADLLTNPGLSRTL